jgi:hypothetical protein
VSMAQTAAAREASKNYAARRAITNPAKVDRCVRTVSLALAEGVVTVDDLAEAVKSWSPPSTAEEIRLLRDALPPVRPDEAA